MKWVIESSGLEIPNVAKRLRVPESTVRGWMRERRKISVAKLESLARYARRPLAVFLLARPPEQPATPDWRRLPSSKSKITRDTALAVRLARYLQEVAGEMMDMSGQDAEPDIGPGATVRQSPEKIALRERGRLGLDAERGPGDARGRFGALRNAVESLNIPVFQQSTDPKEMRGLSLSDGRPCVILVSSKDLPAARRFTLMHEYGHILLRKGGMCVAPADSGTSTDAQDVESWCNKFAGFALMPRAEFREEYEKHSDASGKEIIDLLSRKFATSRSATAIHALNLGLGTQAMVNQALKHKDARPQMRGGGIRPPVKCISERGRKFVSLVLESKQARAISSRDAVVYLGMDLSHTDALREKLS